MKGYPKWFSKNFIFLTSVLLFVSGCLLIPSLLEMRLQWDEIWPTGTEYRTLIVASHTAIGIAMMVIFGALWSIHMRVGWKAKEKRTSGTLNAALFVLLGLTSIGVLYAGDEVLSLGSSIVHTVLGLTLAPVFLIHWRS